MSNSFSLDSFKIHFTEHEIENIEHFSADIIDRLTIRLNAVDVDIPEIQLLKTRTQKHFQIDTTVEFEDLSEKNMTRMQIETANQIITKKVMINK